jgi:hypothetical protein
MRSDFLKRAGAGVVMAAAMAWAAAADEHPAAKRPFDLPPSADLTYKVTARQSGFSLDGKAVINWRANEDKFSVYAESRVSILGKVTENRSQGAVDSFGLAPVEFYQKSFRKDASTSTFDRASKTLSFTQGKQTYPLKGGEQDRASVTWQLVAQARAAGDKLKPGTEWAYFVAGPRDADPWVFRIGKHEKLNTPMGDLDTVHVVRLETEGVKGQKLDIWLAPSQEWYPVKLRFTDDGKDSVEQTILGIVKK